MVGGLSSFYFLIFFSSTLRVFFPFFVSSLMVLQSHNTDNVIWSIYFISCYIQHGFTHKLITSGTTGSISNLNLALILLPSSVLYTVDIQ